MLTWQAQHVVSLRNESGQAPGAFEEASGRGHPKKYDTKFLKSLGYTSSNDQRFLGTVKFIGLADEKGTPMKLWSELRVDPGKAIAKGVRQGYADLFSQYPNAHQRDDEALRTFFSAHTDVGAGAVTKMVSTFKTLCKLADFDGHHIESDATEHDTEEAHVASDAVKHVPSVDAFGQGLVVNINVQLQVPPDATGEIYDKFFDSMRKHLWPSNK